jgi:hypothetical protein
MQGRILLLWHVPDQSLGQPQIGVQEEGQEEEEFQFTIPPTHARVSTTQPTR